MDEPLTTPASPRGYQGKLAQALALIEKIVVDGIKHGHFDYSITCETGVGGRRLLIVKAGKSHKFSITEPDVPE
jgi:hypothetical protein